MDVQGIIARGMAKLYADTGLSLTFRHPTTRTSVSLSAVDRSSVAMLFKEKSLDVSAVKPCCTALNSDLAALNISPAQMVDVAVAFNGRSFRILSVHDKPDPSFRVMIDQLKPAPNWQGVGETLFIMMAL
jgi:hypothetical protein